MTKYMFLYKGPATDMSEMSQEESDAVMKKWQEWMQRLGDALVDVGNPMGESSSVVDDGSDGAAGLLTGYSFVEANSMDEARALADGHPFLSDKTGEFSVDIHEVVPLDM